MPFDLPETIKAIGYLGLFAIIFAESGLFFGFFLPGDSLLITAGLLASQGFFNIWILILLLCFASILGNIVGYWMGNKFGRGLFNKKRLNQATVFYKKHGWKALILGRFIPFVRTFIPIVAGIANMKFEKFLIFNILGGLFWVCGILTLGFVLGNSIPNIDNYLIPIILVIIFVSLIPALSHKLKAGK